MSAHRATNSFGLRHAPTVLLVIDMWSDFKFPDGEAVLRSAERVAPRIARLKTRAAAQRIPCIYINDSFGLWRSDLRTILEYCGGPQSRGNHVTKTLTPGPKDFVVFKPRHSAFYATPLASMLEEAGTQHLILTGVSSHQCILFTANDAHLRELDLTIPGDCIGAPSAAQTRFALTYFRTVLGANIRNSTRLQPLTGAAPGKPTRKRPNR
jgi:isochorismate hydrolase